LSAFGRTESLCTSLRMAAARALPLKNYVLRALLNPLRLKRRIEPIAKWNIVVGDTVQLNTGRNKGKSGKVKKVLRSRNRLVVEGLSLARKHVRPIEGRAGGVISVESPVHYSNVNLVEAASGCVSYLTCATFCC